MGTGEGVALAQRSDSASTLQTGGEAGGKHLMGCIRNLGLKEAALLKPGKTKGQRGKNPQILKSQLQQGRASSLLDHRQSNDELNGGRRVAGNL